MAELGFNWALLAPVLIVSGGAVVGVLLEAFVGRRSRWNTQVGYSLLVILAALVAAIIGYPEVGEGVPLVGNELVLDPAAAIAQMIALVIGLLSLVIVADRSEILDGAFAGQPSDEPGSYDEEVTERERYQRSELFPLMLFSVLGMMVFPMANSMLTLFVALEVISLPLYVLTATARHDRLISQEAGLKYFILGAFSSAFFLMGLAFLYGYSGSMQISDLARAVPIGYGSDLLLLGGIVMVLVGLLFKVSAAPFHAWTPDVYQGAPTPITGFMAAGVKAAAFLMLMRFYFTVGSQVRDDLTIVMWVIAILTMVVGTFFGLVQGNMKRMLAYSSIAHAGFILIALISLDGVAAMSAIAFYVLSYGISSIGAFGIIAQVRTVDADGNFFGEQHEISKWAGLGRKNPVVAAIMLLFLLSFAGIPLTAGFIGKFVVFAAGVSSGATALVIVAVVASAITAFYYFRVAKVMFFDEPSGDTAVVKSQGMAAVGIGTCAVLTLILGIVPDPVLTLLANMSILVP